jgi:hypothetical protein
MSLQLKLYLAIFLSLVPLCAIIIGGSFMGLIEGVFSFSQLFFSWPSVNGRGCLQVGGK